MTTAKNVPNKKGVLTHPMRFPLCYLRLYYKFTIKLCTIYCCNVWGGVPFCYLNMLGKIEKWVCKTVGPELIFSLDILAHFWNLISISLLYKVYFERCSSTSLADFAPFPFSHGRSTHYSDRLHDYPGTILWFFHYYA